MLKLMAAKANVNLKSDAPVEPHDDPDKQLLAAINSNEVKNRAQNIFGLADTDINGFLSFSEVVDLYEGYRTFMNLSDGSKLQKSWAGRSMLGLESNDLAWFKDMTHYQGNVDIKDFLIIRNRRQTFLSITRRL